MDTLNHPQYCAGRKDGVYAENALQGRVFFERSRNWSRQSFFHRELVYTRHPASTQLIEPLYVRIESVREESTDQAPRKSSHRGGRLRKGGPTQR